MKISDNTRLSLSCVAAGLAMSAMSLPVWATGIVFLVAMLPAFIVAADRDALVVERDALRARVRLLEERVDMGVDALLRDSILDVDAAGGPCNVTTLKPKNAPGNRPKRDDV